MVGKFRKSLLLVLVLLLVTTGVVYAEEDAPQEMVRFLGEITNVNLETSSFSLHSQAGDDLRFNTTERTKFRSRDGSIHSLEDLSPGMKALVLAFRDNDGNLVALMIAAGAVGDFEDIHRYNGTISNVDVEQRSFSLEMEEGRIQRFVVGDRTRYRSRDGSISDLADLEPGMVAYVIAIERDSQAPMVLIVAAGQPAEKPERFRVIGQITNVVPGQETFELEANNGDILTFTVIDRTSFRSRDGSINSIHDLKRGMHVLVIGVRNTEGSSIALVVAAADLDDKQGLSKLDVRALGKITSLGDRSFTIETQGQGYLNFSIDGSTIYKSRDGSINSFEDLEVGMIAVVGGKELGNGELKAIIVGAGLPRTERTDLSTQQRPEVITLPEPVSE